MIKTTILTILALILVSTLASAVTIGTVTTPVFAPGEEAKIFIELENNLKDDAKDISLTLELTNVPFVSVGSSQVSIDEIDEGDEEDFGFTLKASNNIPPGDYSIPYTLEFKIDSTPQIRKGTIGISIQGKTKLQYTINTENPVLNQQGQLTLRIINKEFGDAKFVLIKIIPDGFTLLSDDEVYIGEVESDDFETATFDVIFKSTAPKFTARVEYKDFANNNKVEIVELPIKVYSTEEALELGIINKNNTNLYILSAITLILAFILYRTIKRRLRIRKSKAQQSR